MSPVTSNAALKASASRPFWVWGLAVAGSGLAGGLIFVWLGRDHTPAGRPELAHELALASWAVIGLAFAWMRYRPRKAYDRAAVSSRAESFQTKRWWLLMLLTAYIALLLIPLAVWQSLRPDPRDTGIDRLFDAMLLVVPCALTLGLMTTAIYSRQWGAVVDDELTAVHRASAFRLGFIALLAVGAAAYLTALLRPEWALAALPPVISAPVAVAALRFTLLERAAAKGEQ
jgi:hypothetical protein